MNAAPGEDLETHVMHQEAATDGRTLSEDSGLASLAIVGRLHGIPIDANQLRHDFGKLREHFTADDLVLAARRLGLKARALTSSWDRLSQTALPALVQQKDHSYLVAAKIVEDRILLHDTTTNAPVALTRAEFEERWNGSVILITKRSLLPGMSGKFDLSWFIPAVVKYRKQFGEVIAASFFIQILALVSPLFFQVIIDKVLVHNGLTTLDVLAIGLFAVAFFEVILGGLRTYLFSHTTNRVDVELGARLYHHMQRLPIAYFQSRPVGTVVARVRELETVRSFITGSALTVSIDAVFTVVFFAVMYFYSPVLFWIAFATIPCYAALSYFVTPVLRQRLDEKFSRTAENQAFLVESVHAAETVKAMAVEPQMQRRWEEQLAGYVTSAFRAGQLGNIANQLATLISRVATVATLWVGARLVIQGDLTIGQLVAFNMLAGRVSGPILRVVQLWQDFQQTRVSIEKLGEILNSPTEPGYGGQRANMARVQGRVTFDRCSFRYSPNRPEALKNVSLDVRPGEVIGIVGRSGSGKSTFSKLIQRLYVPESGRVSIDGTDLALIDPSSLRRQIGVVLQENVVFRRSVRENIALADPGAPLEAVMEAARLAGAHEFILELPFGYETIIEEHGANLSGGQRQRIAIARALLTNPRILIFDEATSALDYESERIIQENMRLICKGRTVFVIAHRLSAVKPSDRIIMLDKGEIIEEGAHHELIARGGHYAALFNQQAA
jgi:subfamily B ATP-binding cassette protein HlyB/CyaB